jgi:hypothetical protein
MVTFAAKAGGRPVIVRHSDESPLGAGERVGSGVDEGVGVAVGLGLDNVVGTGVEDVARAGDATSRPITRARSVVKTVMPAGTATLRGVWLSITPPTARI